MLLMLPVMIVMALILLMALISRAMYSGYGDVSGAKPIDAMHHNCRL